MATGPWCTASVGDINVAGIVAGFILKHIHTYLCHYSRGCGRVAAVFKTLRRRRGLGQRFRKYRGKGLRKAQHKRIRRSKHVSYM